MLTRYPELLPDPRPQRAVLVNACRATWDRIRDIRTTRGVTMGWTALTVALITVLGLLSTPGFIPGDWVEMASGALIGIAIACVLGEAPGQLIGLLLHAARCHCC
jgi:hypothetical protein